MKIPENSEEHDMICEPVTIEQERKLGRQREREESEHFEVFGSREAIETLIFYQ